MAGCRGSCRRRLLIVSCWRRVDLLTSETSNRRPRRQQKGVHCFDQEQKQGMHEARGVNNAILLT